MFVHVPQLVPLCPGVAQGMITGIRGLCNGLGPALYGFIFFLFNVELSDIEPVAGGPAKSAEAINQDNDLLSDIFINY